MKTKRYSQICLKEGNLHDDVRNEKNIKIDAKYTDNISYVLWNLGYITHVKWFRTRS